MNGEVLEREPGTASPQQSGGRLPLHRPVVLYVLLALIGLMFVAETVLGGSQQIRVLAQLGAQVNTLVAAGEWWRLVASMFIHIGIPHLLFNSWALLSIGRDIEMFYGSVWFTLIYFVSGLAGNVAYYCLGDNILSAGASGAVFGLIGAEVAFFLVNRRMFGGLARQRLGNLAVIIGINLVFGFTVPGINNIAHLGGLFAGTLLGLALAPRYGVEWQWSDGVPTGAWQDTRGALVRVVAVAIAFAVLFGGIQIGNARWNDSTALLRERGLAAMDAGDLSTAQGLLEQVVAKDATDTLSLANLGIIYMQRDRLDDALSSLEKAHAIAPDNAEIGFYLGVAYAEAGRMADARPLMQAYLDNEPEGRLADLARQVLEE